MAAAPAPPIHAPLTGGLASDVDTCESQPVEITAAAYTPCDASFVWPNQSARRAIA